MVSELMGEMLPQALLSTNDVLDVVSMSNRGIMGKVIAKKYGVSVSAVSGILCGRNWRWLTKRNNEVIL